MPLNIDATSKKRAAAPTTSRSRPLVGEVVDALTSWGPRDFIGAFQRFHAGSISLIHLNVLILLEGTGPLPMSRLAEALDISVASITGVIDRMEARGLVERRRDDADRRIVLVQPAEGGRRLFAEIDAKRRKGLSKLLEKLSEKDLKGLLEGHQALRQARAEMAQRLAARQLDETVAQARASRATKIDALLARANRPAGEGRR